MKYFKITLEIMFDILEVISDLWQLNARSFNKVYIRGKIKFGKENPTFALKFQLNIWANNWYIEVF